MSGHGSATKGTSARSRRRKSGGHDGGEEGNERWLVTYADMLTLLLVLFIVLFSISVVNTSKYISLKTSLATAFGSGEKSLLDGGTSLNSNADSGTGQQMVMGGMPVIPNVTKAPTSVPTATAGHVDYSIRAQKEVSNYQNIEKSINTALSHNGLNGAVQFGISQRGLVITVVTNALVFGGNSATLLGEGQSILEVIAPPLERLPNNIEVDGYTNQAKVSTAPYPSGWELSSARASAVVRYLTAGGVSESRLSAVGFSDQRPLYPASDPRSITRNRRVEIVVLSTLPADAGNALQAAAR
jgi:chemotaxis protein MotB